MGWWFFCNVLPMDGGRSEEKGRSCEEAHDWEEERANYWSLWGCAWSLMNVLPMDRGRTARFYGYPGTGVPHLINNALNVLHFVEDRHENPFDFAQVHGLLGLPGYGYRGRYIGRNFEPVDFELATLRTSRQF
eukprot:2092579-Rhodomonas_salina.1